MVHTPGPDWNCGCGKAWPCDTAREQLALDYINDPVGLAVYMAGQMGRAADELYHLQPDEIYDRFMAWTRPVRRATRAVRHVK